MSGCPIGRTAIAKHTNNLSAGKAFGDWGSKIARIKPDGFMTFSVKDIPKN
ncbi:hypothetical protein ACWIUA_11275 [Ursidibacter sp. B-7004-1]